VAGTKRTTLTRSLKVIETLLGLVAAATAAPESFGRKTSARAIG
jgi:hypothetical protein